MDNRTKTTGSYVVGQDRASVDDLRKTADSLIENIGAFQLALDRLRRLEQHRVMLRTVMARCAEYAPPDMRTRMLQALEATENYESPI